MAGAPGAPGAAAARQGQGAGTTRSLDLETTSTTTTTQSLDLERAVARTPRPWIARLSSNAQLMEVGEAGALFLPAARHVVEGRRRELDSATTQPLLMAGLSVLDYPLKNQTVTLRLVQIKCMDAGVCGLPGLHAVLNAVRVSRQEIELATIRPHKMEATIVPEKERKVVYAIQDHVTKCMDAGVCGLPGLHAVLNVVRVEDSAKRRVQVSVVEDTLLTPARIVVFIRHRATATATGQEGSVFVLNTVRG